MPGGSPARRGRGGSRSAVHRVAGPSRDPPEAPSGRGSLPLRIPFGRHCTRGRRRAGGRRGGAAPILPVRRRAASRRGTGSRGRTRFGRIGAAEVPGTASWERGRLARIDPHRSCHPICGRAARVPRTPHPQARLTEIEWRSIGLPPATRRDEQRAAAVEEPQGPDGRPELLARPPEQARQLLRGDRDEPVKVERAQPPAAPRAARLHGFESRRRPPRPPRAGTRRCCG